MKIIAGGALLLSIVALVVAIIRPHAPDQKPRDHSVHKPVLEEMSPPILPQNPFQLPTYPILKDDQDDRNASVGGCPVDAIFVAVPSVASTF